ncbi:MAG: error-prone DNA polymerase, partial [Alphaproteobacteria bacterium]|nr:error-prone DNA polymerase [Alphaproteobacteria bacterium]
NILCQGRGSAANSVVCYCLGITEVDPADMSMLFERFISRERKEPPDIDVDFEHTRREEVIQYLYDKYGRDRAALTATVICYRPRSALRDVGKALGFDPAALHALSKGVRWWDGREIERERLVEGGLDPDALKVRQLGDLTRDLMGFPRPLSPPPSGSVLTIVRLSRRGPNPTAATRCPTPLEWARDGSDAAGRRK